MLYFPSDNTNITNQEVPVLLPPTTNFIGQLFHIELEGSYFIDIYVYDDTVLFHTPSSLF